MTLLDALAAVLSRSSAGGWAGHDPYDSLLSGTGRAVSPLGFLPRFALSQLALRSRFVRGAIRPPTSVNPKGLALFLGAAIRGREALGEERTRTLARSLVTDLDGRGARVADGTGWGYPFPWQSRSFWAPAETPNAVVTSTVGWHLLDCGDALADGDARDLGIEAGRFLYSALAWTEVGRGLALAYTPHDHTRVVNISALGARLLARVAAATASAELGAVARRLVRFVVEAQRRDGSWPYSLERGGAWEDSFHTGYILESLVHCRELGLDVPDGVMEKGIDAYARFFGDRGEARLTARPGSVLDAHSAAQGILTYLTIADSSFGDAPDRAAARKAAGLIADWALRELWIPERGHFAYRTRGGRRDERDFTRWVQAWMALALATASSANGLDAVVPARSEAGVA